MVRLCSECGDGNPALTSHSVEEVRAPMIIQGEPFGPHYGPVALGEPTEELFHFCRTWGARWARLVKRLTAG